MSWAFLQDKGKGDGAEKEENYRPAYGTNPGFLGEEGSLSLPAFASKAGLISETMGQEFNKLGSPPGGFPFGLAFQHPGDGCQQRIPVDRLFQVSIRGRDRGTVVNESLEINVRIFRRAETRDHNHGNVLEVWVFTDLPVEFYP
jgi:hypothetical protein